MRKFLIFLIAAFFLYFVLTNPAGFTDAVNDIATFLRNIFDNLVDAFDALFS